MTNYDGNDKGFVYVACDAERWNEVISRYLEPVESEDRRFCLGKTRTLRRRDKTNIAKAHALLIFLTKELLGGNKLEDIVTIAVDHNKPMLLVHLDDVELDPLLTMQTDAQQALFRKRYKTDEKLIEEIKKAAIFDNMQVTPAQKKQQKRRILLPLAAVTAVAVMALVIILRQTVLIPDDGSVNALGLPGVSERDLAKIEEIHICGNEILSGNVDAEYDWYEDSDERDTSRIRYWWEKDRDAEEWEEGYTTPGDISDLSGLEQLTNLRVLELEGQQIEDISPLVKAYGRKGSTFYDDFLKEDASWQIWDEDDDQDKNFELSLRCNPISSIDGLEKFETLGNLDVSFTNVSELPEGLDVRELNISYTNVSELPESLSKLDRLDISGTNISELPEDLDVRSLGIENTAITEIPDFKGKSDVAFWAHGIDFEDYSKLATAENYEDLGLDAYGNSAEIIEALKGKQMGKFCCNDLQISNLEELSEIDVSNCLELWSASITSLDGIEHFKGIEELCLGGCEWLTDLSDVNKLKSLKRVRLWQEQAYLADGVDDRIEVIIE